MRVHRSDKDGPSFAYVCWAKTLLRRSLTNLLPSKMACTAAGSSLASDFNKYPAPTTGARRVRVAFNAKPLYFLASALLHERAKKPILRLASKRRKKPRTWIG